MFSSTITLDKTPPFSFIIFPENNKTYNILTSISGTSSDNFTIDKMELSLKNIDDNLYLNGANWITDEVFISVSGTNNWTYKTGELPDSKTYFVKVRGLDKAGNVQQLISTCTFTYIAPASHFAITGINEPLPAGTTTGITFEVKNKNNNRVINYTGTVKFESNDSRATLPANYTFTPEDKGVHTLNDSIILRTVGDITLKLIDTSDANVSSQKKIKVIPDIPAKITVSAIKTPVETCIPQDVNIEVRDKYENCVDTYTGTVTFESSDKRASLPTDYTFAISDYGKKTFTKSVSFKTTGYAYLKVYDKSDPNISGSQENIEVYTVLSEPVDSLLALPADLDKIKLEWQPSISLNVSQYNIYWDRSTGEMDFNNPVMTLAHPGNTYTFDGLKTETEYKFIVRGVNNAGYIENNMNIVNATPLSSAFETKATIKVPHTGHKISGNRITIVAEIINGEISDADNVLFEYRAANNNDWNTITPANSQDTNPDKSHPYFIHWDVTNIQAGTYNLRAIVTDRTGTKDKTPSAITVFVNHNNFDLQEQYNESTGEYIKTQKVNNARDNKIKIGDINVNNIIELLLPAQSLAVDSTTLKISYNPELRPENPYREPPVSPLWQIELGNEQSELKNDKEATLYFPYKDDNNDNKIDNTEFLEKDLVLKKFSTGKHKWEKITLQEVDYEKNICKARVSSFSYFRMFNALSERLSEVIIYPNPFKPSQGHKYVKFDKLSYSTTIKIYTLSGELVWAK
ncbi:MAG: fibronectin type III domain-containing protein, partial [Elusimicrobiota bacterium]